MAHPLSGYFPVADAVAKLFQPHVEVVIHDVVKDEIAHIANPYSGRKPGDPSLLGPLVEQGEDFPARRNVEGPYENAGNRGQRIRSISAALRDSEENVIGMMCINADFSTLEAGLDLLENFLRPVDTQAPPKVLFQNDWKDNIKLEIRCFLQEQQISFDAIDAGHRKTLIKRIEDKGLLYARKSAEQLATLLGVSRATIYNDLKQIRKNTAGPLPS